MRSWWLQMFSLYGSLKCVGWKAHSVGHTLLNILLLFVSTDWSCSTSEDGWMDGGVGCITLLIRDHCISKFVLKNRKKMTSSMMRRWRTRKCALPPRTNLSLALWAVIKHPLPLLHLPSLCSTETSKVKCPSVSWFKNGDFSLQTRCLCCERTSVFVWKSHSNTALRASQRSFLPQRFCWSYRQ